MSKKKSDTYQIIDYDQESLEDKRKSYDHREKWQEVCQYLDKAFRKANGMMPLPWEKMYMTAYYRQFL